MIIRKIALLILAIMLGACSSSNNGSSNPPNPQPSTSVLDGFFTQAANADPTDITDPESIGMELNQVFGAANAQPVIVNDGDDINTVRNRAAAGG